MKLSFYLSLFAFGFTVAIKTLAADAPQLTAAGKQLKRAYKQSSENAVKPIRERYLTELRKLQEQYSRSGKLDDALALKLEIEQVEAESERNKALDYVGGWNSPYGPVYISADRTARNGGSAGTWDVQGGGLVITWSNGFKHRYPLLITGDSIQAKEVSPQGKETPFTLTRIK